MGDGGLRVGASSAAAARWDGSHELEERLEQALATYAVPGAQVGLLRGGERLVVCCGSSDREGRHPIDATTPFHAGSLAKSLAALVVLDAARRGEVDLDGPCDAQAEGLWDDTPRALLTQTSGRPDLLPEPAEDLADYVTRVGLLPRMHVPGRFSYCNAGWAALDLLLLRRTGSGFEARAAELLSQLLPAGPGSAWRPRFGVPAGASRPHRVARDGSAEEVPATFADAASAAGSRWWASADELLDWASVQLAPPAGWSAEIHQLRAPGARLPGGTVFDAWGHGWALWDREDHQAFGWAGFTGGHRAYLRCFPDQDAALVVLANAAGPLFGPPGGSALFDDLLPDLLEHLDVPALTLPATDTAALATEQLAGRYGPMEVGAVTEDPEVLLADVSFLGEPEPVRFRRQDGSRFTVEGDPPGAMPIAFEDGLAYVGPFALPRL
jgi:CubicO group peptidase (beta-lactamase class C family)